MNKSFTLSPNIKTTSSGKKQNKYPVCINCGYKWKNYKGGYPICSNCG